MNELAAAFEISQPAVTKHLGVLEQAGLIARRQDGRFRFSLLKPGAMDPADRWLRDFCAYWEERLYAFEETQYDEQ